MQEFLHSLFAKPFVPSVQKKLLVIIIMNIAIEDTVLYYILNVLGSELIW